MPEKKKWKKKERKNVTPPSFAKSIQLFLAVKFDASRRAIYIHTRIRPEQLLFLDLLAAIEA